MQLKMSSGKWRPFSLVVNVLRYNFHIAPRYIFWTHIRYFMGLLRVAHAPGMPGTFFMHHGACVTHVSLCMPGSLTSGFLWSRWRGKRSRHSRRMRNPQFYVSGKRFMGELIVVVHFEYFWECWQSYNMAAPNTARVSMISLVSLGTRLQFVL